MPGPNLRPERAERLGVLTSSRHYIVTMESSRRVLCCLDWQETRKPPQITDLYDVGKVRYTNSWYVHTM